MKYSYPIKYAVMPIKTRFGRDGNPYTIYNIISKCYLLEERKKYNENGYEYIEYYVVFPFQNDCGVVFRKLYPDIRDASIVKNVYDTYDEAKEEKEKRNIKTLCLTLSSYDSYDEYLNVRKQRETYFHKLEELIEKNTPELLVGMVPKKHKIVEVKPEIESYLVLNDESFYFNLYCLTKHSYDNKAKNFVIYSINDDEYNKLVQLVNNVNISFDNFMHTPLIMGTEHYNVMKLISPSGDKCDLVVDHIDENCYYSNQKIFNEPSSFDFIIFTTETYTDILNSFNLNPDIETTIDIGYQRQMWSLYKL